MKNLFEQLITSIGEDTARQGLKDTPARAAKAWTYLTRGYHEDLGTLINDALFESSMSEMIIVKDIEMYSMCEHHLLPFIGKCHVGYIPSGKVLGLSKVARIVDFFSARLQIQERLTEEIAHCINEVTNAKGVAVVIEAKHLCMMMRGVEKQNPCMVTSVMLGSIREEDSTRAEFLSLIR